MSPEEYERQDIEILNEVRPYCFESDREEQWFKIGLQYGLDAADAEPLSRWISVKEDLPCNHEDLLDPMSCNNETIIVLTVCGDNYSFDWMRKDRDGKWIWNSSRIITHWMNLPEPPKE